MTTYIFNMLHECITVVYDLLMCKCKIYVNLIYANPET